MDCASRCRRYHAKPQHINHGRAPVLLVPPLPEQRAIAHILGTLDDKIELNRRMNATLEAMARALFKSWFVDFDPVRAKAEGRDTGLPARSPICSRMGSRSRSWGRCRRVGGLDSR